MLMLDQSRSIGLFGSFFAAKTVAIALYALIQSRFPRDYFSVVGFSDLAMGASSENLAEMTRNEWVRDANIFRMATSRYSVDFVDKMTRIHRGRAFDTTTGQLGQHVMATISATKQLR